MQGLITYCIACSGGVCSAGVAFFLGCFPLEEAFLFFFLDGSFVVSIISTTFGLKVLFFGGAGGGASGSMIVSLQVF
jgi:hypothetical protein